MPQKERQFFLLTMQGPADVLGMPYFRFGNFVFCVVFDTQVSGLPGNAATWLCSSSPWLETKNLGTLILDFWKLLMTTRRAQGNSSPQKMGPHICWKPHDYSSSWIIMNHHDSLWTITNHHESPCSMINHHQSSWIIVDRHTWLWTIMNHHESS